MWNIITEQTAEIGIDKMEKQIIIEPFLNVENWNYYKHPVTSDVYRMSSDTTTTYDLTTGMPLAARWLCSNESFGEYKNLFMYYL
jgi:hypothetical protein